MRGHFVKKMVLFASLMSVSALGVSGYASLAWSAVDVNAVRFVDEDWDARLFFFIDDVEPDYVAWGTDFAIAPPPLNDSDETLADLAVLRDYAAHRRSQTVLEQVRLDYGLVDDGVDLSYALSNPLVLDERAGGGEAAREAVQALVREVSLELAHFVFVEVKRFGRARPDKLAGFLGDDFEAAIVTPSYPSYPAVLAAGARLFANVLGYVDPLRGDDYKARAAEVSLRSEIAGLHYPTDTLAGVQIADEYFERAMNNEVFKSKVDGLVAALGQ